MILLKQNIKVFSFEFNYLEWGKDYSDNPTREKGRKLEDRGRKERGKKGSKIFKVEKKDVREKEGKYTGIIPLGGKERK